MKLSYILILIVVLVAAFFMFAPDDRIDAALRIFESPQERARSKAAHGCFEFYLDRINHPDTAELVDYTLANEQVFIEVRADNSFGVPSRLKFDCLLDEDGEFDLNETLIRNLRRIGNQ